ncbi:RNA recognition motif-containing protein [Orbilia brochopaga]|uniref:RNA recognition motif-containing protein n=1 Tax=Orbilia brochopaga TaxID=3140254 RepID=A0AAV9VDE7_9PEZI
MAPPPKKLKTGHLDPPSEPGDQAEAQDIAGQRTIFVRSLNYSTTTESLAAHFSYFAPLKHATVVVDPATKSSRGFGFVTFTDPADALKAVRECDGKLFEGRHIKVEIAQARHREHADGNGADTSATASTATASTVKKEKRGKGGEEVKKRNPRLIVRNLAWSVKKPEQLAKHFEKFGKVKEVIIPRKDGKFGPMSGFAFVTLKKVESARKAIDAVNGTEIDGRTVAVDWAIEKDEWKQQAGKDGEDGLQDDDSDDSEEGEDEEDDTMDIDGSDSESSSNEDDEMEDLKDDDDGVSATSQHISTNDTVVFIRNLAFTTEEDGLYEHFRDNFGPIRYARVVLEPETGRPRGTAFVSFYRAEDYEACLASAPKDTVQAIPSSGKDRAHSKQSVLQSESLDPTGKYTLDGRVLAISRAVSKDEAGRLAAAGTAAREKTKSEKRRLYLLQEGQITANNPLYRKLSAADVKMREDSYKQRKTFLEKNTSLHLSLTRLSVRNIPRNITEKDLKMLARKAIVGFAREVKDGKRGAISKEEARRGGADAKEEEANRKAKGKGVVRQAKIIREKDGAGRSMGYGFIEYIGHRWALMGLRWLNGREVAHLPADEADQEKQDKKADILEVTPEDRKRRLIVEFALENVQVVQRRREKEKAAKGRLPRNKQAEKEQAEKEDKGKLKNGRKRKRSAEGAGNAKADQVEEEGPPTGKKGDNPEKWDKMKRAARIIARKRQKRRMRRE